MDLGFENHVQTPIHLVNVNGKGAFVFGSFRVQTSSDILQEHGRLFPAVFVSELFSLDLDFLTRIGKCHTATI